MVKAERFARLERVARVIDDEIFFQRHGFMPAADRADPAPAIVALAEAAIMAADGESAALDRLRATRQEYLATLLDLPDRAEATDDILMLDGAFDKPAVVCRADQHDRMAAMCARRP